MHEHIALDIAAKAAGYQYNKQWKSYWLSSAGGSIWDGYVWRCWNPLTNNTDAFRLAVMLKLKITHQGETVTVSASDGFAVSESYKPDPLGLDALAATRRAIVQVAAYIGREQTAGAP